MILNPHRNDGVNFFAFCQYYCRVICLKKHKDTAYTKGVFSSLIIFLVLAVLTVFPNLWDYFAVGLNPIVFKTVPFLVVILSVCIIFCLYQGMSFVFYSERKGEKISLRAFFTFFSPARFLRIANFYFLVNLIKLIAFVMIFLPDLIFLGCSVLFYKNSCPVMAVGTMFAATLASFIISSRFYGEISNLLFLSRFCFFENNKAKIKDIIMESSKKMKGKGSKIRILRQSFFLSFISCIFIIPIPFVLTNYKNAVSKKAYELMKG